jgi:uncharacterized protein involved in outer membrane biogenesis
VRYVLTIIAVALVAVMSVALVAPYLIDWSAERGELEARLGAITGANVSLTGPVELRLLPTPYLALGEGLVSAPGPDGAKLSFGSARLELELVKLPSGQIRFSDIRLEKPVLTLTRGPDGALKLPPLRMAGLHSTGFDRLIIQDGQAKIVGGAGGASEISGVEIDASAPSLDGPAHLSGQFSGPDNAPVVFRLASDKPGPEGTPVRVAVDAGPSWPAAEFDGALEGDPAAGIGGLRFAGAATLSGTAPGENEPTPWRVAGPIAVDLDRATIRGAEFRLGPEERAIRADGDATLAFGSPVRISVAFKAKQANVDSLMRRKGEDGVAPARAVTLLTRIVSATLQGRESQMSVDAQVSAQPVTLGAQTLPDANATLKAEPGAPMHLTFNLSLPGQTRLSGAGDLKTGAEAKFRGDVAFTSADFALVRDWAALGAPPAVAKIAAFGAALPYGGASLSGAVEASASGFSGRNLKLTLDRSTLTGALAFTAPVGGQGRLDVDLTSDSLDVDALPSLAAAKTIGDLDVSLSLRAGSLHIARVGETEIESGSLALNATKTGPDVALKRLSVTGLDGAALDIAGAIGPDSATATGRLRADRLRDFAALVSRLAPGDLSRMLVERASELSPAALTFDAHGRAAEAGGVPAIDWLRASGSAGETQFSIAFDPGPKNAGRALTVNLDSPNSGALLRQLGVNAATTASGRGRIALNASGGWEKGYDIDATSQLAGSDLTWRGRFLPAGGSDDARLFGSAKIKAPNLAPIAAALGLAPANGGALGPADIGFDATLRGDRWTFSRLAATIAGVKASGDLTFQPVQPAAPLEASAASAEISRAEEAVGSGAAQSQRPTPAPAAIEGALTVERMPLGGVLALALGPRQPARAGARWSDVRFAPASLRPPSAAVKLRVGTVDMSDAFAAHDFATTLRFDKGRLDLDDFAMRIAGGGASGHATLHRDAETVTLTGALNLDSVDLDRPGFSGRVSAALDFASTGRSPAAVINGLAGSGAVTFAGAQLARSDPGALDRVVARAQAPDASLDETNIAFALGAELNRAPLAIPDGSAPVALSAGVMKIGPITIPEGRSEGTLRADLDLRRLAADTRLALVSPTSDLKFWSGPPPSATVTAENALDAPKRQIEASTLSAALAAQAIARETDRIATMEADIRERAFFNRRLKGERFMDRRRQEIEDWQVEQARLKGQAERLRDLEEAEKAAEIEAAKKAAADKAAAEKAEPDKGAADNAQAVKTDTPQYAPATTTNAPFAPAPEPKSDQVGANAPPPAAPTPPPRPRARPTQIDPAPSKLY